VTAPGARPDATAHAAPGPPSSAEGAELRRALGVGSATLLVVGGIIGGGIFFTPAEVARPLPSADWALFVWFVGGVVALAGALTYAELGAMMPAAGGPYVYIREAFGPLPAFLYGWMVLASIATGALAAVAMGFASSLGRLVPLDAVGGALPVAAATIVLLTITNCLGIKPGAAVTNVLTVAKIAVLALIIVGGLLLWARVGPPPPVADAPAPRASLAVALAAAFPPVLFTIGGWQQMNMVAGEIRDPGRTIPRALFLGIAVVIACYLGANAVYLRALGRDGVAASAAVASDAAVRLLGPAGARAVAIGVMLSILGFVNVTILANSRIVFAMARDGAFLASAAKVHPRFGSPHVSIVVMCALALALLALTRGDLGQLLSAVVFADWIFFGLGAASVFALRRKWPDAVRPYRALGYPAVPAFFVLAAVVGIVSSFVAAPRTSLLGAALLAIGAVVFRARAAKHDAT
jgi:APA family basic amino acid/polyamine antiporter